MKQFLTQRQYTIINQETFQIWWTGLKQKQGQLLGFASYGAFRAWAAYQYTVEHSVYIHKNYRGQGIGVQLLLKLIEAAKEQQYHTMIGSIDLNNTA